MTDTTVYISGTGIISALGTGLLATEKALRDNLSAIKPLTLFPLLQGAPLPVGQVDELEASSSLPRTHWLAEIAARQAMAGGSVPPDAIIIGTTTGGIATTEVLLRNQEPDKELYRYHGLNTVARYVAEELGCSGPALAVSTACSSGVVAIALGLLMLRSGRARSVLAGGVDSLSRLTYFGFHSLQLVDRNGCKPLDINRQGMAVGEGAGMLLLTTVKPDVPCAELLGAGLSCDAYHAAAPHPEGHGAFTAMQSALADAGIRPEDIGYINLHGTGTPDNDLAESKAVLRLFTVPPPLSSIKGASGHSLAAAGGLEAVVSAIAVSQGLMPANTGLVEVDPLLGVKPIQRPMDGPVKAVLSNSFGFGGNNGSLVIGASGAFPRQSSPQSCGALAIHGYACLSGAGNTAATMERIKTGVSAAGMAGLDQVSENLPPQLIRRLKRLPRMTLSLAVMAHKNSGFADLKPGSVFMGTGWGALSETHDFLTRLQVSNEQFPSPTDFVGSVHNGPASQVAIMFGATGANITASGGDYSFEQALLAADLMVHDAERPALILGADEGHAAFSPLLDVSVEPGTTLADGGGAFCVNRVTKGAKCCISVPFFASSQTDKVIDALVASLGTIENGQSGHALVLAGIPAAMQVEGETQLEEFLALAILSAPVVRYRRFTGEFASASAVAAAFAASFLEAGVIPGNFVGGHDIVLDALHNKILVLGLGQYITAMELYADTVQ
ncbi:MAG: beta-ketoacyl-[acyl-carrier-protein] synthase family protein [Pseudomonadota bacterium]